MGFNERAWVAVKHIPSGRVSTYAAVANALGSKKAARAVGSAMAANPTPLQVPCHRVVCSDGRVGGYARGVEQKIMLLELEGVKVRGGRIVGFDDLFFPL